MLTILEPMTSDVGEYFAHVQAGLQFYEIKNHVSQIIKMVIFKPMNFSKMVSQKNVNLRTVAP